MAGAEARFVLQTLLARDPEGPPSRALVTKRVQLSFSPSCESRALTLVLTLLKVRGAPPIHDGAVDGWGTPDLCGTTSQVGDHRATG